ERSPQYELEHGMRGAGTQPQPRTLALREVAREAKAQPGAVRPDRRRVDRRSLVTDGQDRAPTRAATHGERHRTRTVAQGVVAQDVEDLADGRRRGVDRLDVVAD